MSYAISVTTARFWFHKLGCAYRDMKSGMYFDGHDREDVLQYRVETYLPAYSEHRDYTEIWIDASMEEARTWDSTPMAERQIFCYQDECVYKANDGERMAWWPPTMHGLRKKGEGQGIMIS
ncbi:unnamed protein product, partial [Ectocarpus sp. 13 AM-2016]